MKFLLIWLDFDGEKVEWFDNQSVLESRYRDLRHESENKQYGFRVLFFGEAKELTPPNTIRQ